MSKVVAIVQARMGSTRFPAKMSARLGTCSLLEWVLIRAKKSKLIDELVLATSTNPINDVLIEIATRLSVATFRGSEDDVLSRFASVVKLYNAETVVRICGDNPFVDPTEIDRLIAYFQTQRVDYAFNHQNRSDSGYADGFGAEIFSAEILLSLFLNDLTDSHKEHVTLFINENKNMYDIGLLAAPKDLAWPDMKFDVDHPKDLIFLETLIAAGVNLNSNASDIINTARSINHLNENI